MIARGHLIGNNRSRRMQQLHTRIKIQMIGKLKQVIYEGLFDAWLHYNVHSWLQSHDLLSRATARDMMLYSAVVFARTAVH